ncbi:MAG: hypothetical protein WAQ25_03210 [Candidatus Saccharimonas sp.]
MNPKLKNTLNLMLGLALIALLGWLLFTALIELYKWYNGLSESIQTGIITAIPIILVAIVGYFANQSLETKRSVEQAMRPRKLELYDDFLKFIMRIFGNEKVNKRPTDDDMMKFFVTKTPELMTFASNNVIEKWGKLRVSLSDENTKDEQKMFIVEDLFRAIRSDLGHSRRGSHKGDILRLFINDIDEHLKK